MAVGSLYPTVRGNKTASLERGGALRPARPVYLSAILGGTTGLGGTMDSAEKENSEPGGGALSVAEQWQGDPRCINTRENNL